MYLSAHVLGKSVADKIASAAARPLLVIGRDTFYRRDLAAVGCFNFLAAQNLSALMATLGPRDTREVFERLPPSALVLPKLGSVSLAVLGAAFEAKGLGGDRPLEAWVTRHRPTDATREYVTFSTLKQAEAKRQAGERRASKRHRQRTHARRDQAQRLRVGRFIERQERGRDVTE